MAGKGGTGKTTVAAALALMASRHRKNVLVIELDAKGDLMRALGHPAVGFKPKVIHQNITALAVQPEESLREYLHLYFRVPGLAMHTPLARVFDFIATGVPGPKDLVIIGKVAYEERRRDKDGHFYWDTIVVDCTATGQALPQLTAAKSMKSLVKGGVIAKHTEWVDQSIRSQRHSALCLVSTPEEMPVAEAIELYDGAKRNEIPLGVCFFNRKFDMPLNGADRDVLGRVVDNSAPASKQQAGNFRHGLELADTLTTNGDGYRQMLQRAIDIPVIDIPFFVAPFGLGTTRAVAAILQEGGQTA